MESIESRTSARHSATRTALLLSTALGCVGYAAPAGAQNIVSYGTTDYSLTRSERTDGGPRTIDISTSGGNITLDLGEVTSVNNGTSIGVAIGANNTGTGSVSIRNTSATTTGTGNSNAIDARSTSGAITVDAGTTQGTGTGIGLAALSNTGAITVTSTNASGRYGIFASSTGSADLTGGAVRVTSAAASAGMTGNQGTTQKVGIVAQGGTVVLDSGTVTVRSSTGGNGIFASSGKGTTVRATDTRVEGNNVYGVRAYSLQALSITTGTVTTQGANGVGIGAFGDQSTTIASGTITTNGTSAHGIRVQAATGQSTDSAQVTDITSDSITTNGTGSSAIYVTPGTGATTIRSNAVTSVGAGTPAIWVTGGSGAIDITSATMNVGTKQAISAQSSGAAAVTVKSTEIRSVLGGIGATGRGATTVTSDRIIVEGTSQGSFANAIGASGHAVSVTSGTITAAGAGGTGGIAVSQFNTAGATDAVTVTSGSVAANGNGGAGIQVFGTTGPVSVTSTGAVSTNGTWLTTGSGTNAFTRYADGIRVANAAGAITVDSNDVTTLGNQAMGVRVEAGQGIQSFAIPTGTTLGTGPISVISRGTISTAGQEATGIVALTGNSAATIDNRGTIRPAGAWASGIDARFGAGELTITSRDIEAIGESAYGIRIDQQSGYGDAPGSARITLTGTTKSTNHAVNVDMNAGAVAITNMGAIVTAGTSNFDGHGIEVEGPVDVTVDNSGSITTAGIRSQGIEIEEGRTVAIRSASIQGGGNGVIGINATGTTSLDVTSGLVAGYQSGITAYGGTVRVASERIDTTGGVGLTASADGAVTIKTGTINLVSTQARGTSGALTAFGNAITIDSDTIVASGLGNRFGISAQAINYDADGKTGPLTITSRDITTTGNGAYGMLALGGTGAMTITSTGTITTAGGTRFVGNGDPRQSNGIWAITAAAPVTITSNAISTAGDNANGIAVEAGSAVTSFRGFADRGAAQPIAITSTGAITTLGANANGILVQAGGSHTRIANSGTITTSGANAMGIQVQANGGATTIVSNAVATSGAGATGIRVAGGTGAVDVTATTTGVTGTMTNAIDLASSGAVRVDGGTASATSGSAILVRAGGMAYVRAANATGGGDGHAGVSVVGGTGVTLAIGAAQSSGTALTDTNGTVTRADAVFAQATNGAIDATIGSARASGAGADAVRLIANGDGGAVTARVTGTLASDSGYGLFIDPPGAVTISVAGGATIAGQSGGISTVGGSNAITNAGTISATGGAAITAMGATALDNSGTLTGSGGTAVQLGASNDMVTLRTGSMVTGAIVGGGGTDAAMLIGTSSSAAENQMVANFAGFDSLAVNSGYWTAPSTGMTSVARTTIDTAAALEVQSGANGLTGFASNAFVSNGTLVVRTSGTGSDPFGTNTVTGTGGVTFTGTGTTTLSGANMLATTGTNRVEGGTLILTGAQGGTFATVGGGTLQIGNGGTTGDFTGNLVNNGTLVINRSNDIAYNGALTGSGVFVKEGAGRVVFGTGYGFTGTTVLNGGSIRLSTPVAANTELDVRGSGTVDLSGQANTVAQLAGNSTTAIVNVAGGALTVNQASSTTFAGNVEGDGSLTKSGSGTLNLTGTNSYTGPTTVTGGKLAVNGSIVSPVTVASGGTLGGTGTVGTTAIASGGIYAPGNSIGKQTVNGNVGFAAGAIYQVEVNAAGQSDQVNATGTATLSGGTVQVLAENGNYGRLTSYTILTAAGGVNGRFASVTSNYAFLTPLLGYQANAVTLTLARNDFRFDALATNRNQAQVANAIFARGASDALFNTVLFQSNATAPLVFGELAGELNAGLSTELADSGRRIRHAVFDRAMLPGGEGVSLWAQGLQSQAMSDANSQRARLVSDRTGIVGGLDYRTGETRIDVFGGWQDQDAVLRGRGARADIKTGFAGADVIWSSGALSIQAGGLYTWHDIRTTRTLPVSGFGNVAATPDAHSAQLFAEASHTLTRGQVAVTPFLRHAYIHTRVKGFAESGSLAALGVAGQDRDIGIASVGIRVGGSVPVGTATLLPRLSIAYERTYGDRIGTATQRLGGSGPTFITTGAGLGRDGLAIESNLDLVMGRLSIGVGSFASTADRWSDYGGKARIGLRF
ncbi:autotransporter-associated beta strand repeat-containing protein [Sphingomonas sp. 1185]|uniref:autotransporter-associated beta strand repeat-containing protein n=1 Tax=Sphingomonas sp. 1185 TaxID=3156411 RepID=UPI0033966BEC